MLTFWEKTKQQSSLTMHEKNILMPLFNKKYFIEGHNGLLGPSPLTHIKKYVCNLYVKIYET